MRRRSIVFMWAVFLLCSLSAITQEQKTGLSLEMKVAKETTVKKDGKIVTELVPVETAFRGDILVYTLTYRNEEKEKLTKAAFVALVPEGTVYIEGSATDAGITDIFFSIDKGSYFQKPPVKYFIKKKDGSREERIATPDMYTNVRWVFRRALAPGETGRVTYKTKVK
jgi:uncharacterized repeat protein (TIGR01451 family)